MTFFKATGVFAQKSSDPEILHGGKQSGSLFSAVSWLHGVPTGKENVELGPAEPTHTTCRLVQMCPEVPSIEKTRIDLETHLLKIKKKKGKKDKQKRKELLTGKCQRKNGGNCEIRLSPFSNRDWNNPSCQDSDIFKCRSPSTSPRALTNYIGQPSNLAVEKPADSTLLLTAPAMSQTESNAPGTLCGSPAEAPRPHCFCRRCSWGRCMTWL